MQIEITPEYLASQHLSPTFPERFWKYVQKTEGCWIWIGDKNLFNRGRIYGGRGNKNQNAPRASYILHKGPIPEGLHICHTCDNPLCVNPTHLWAGTRSDNMRDMIKKNRGNKVFGEKHHKHKLTQGQVIEIHKLYDSGRYTSRELGKQFGVSKTAILYILKGVNWKSLIHKLPQQISGSSAQVQSGA